MITSDKESELKTLPLADLLSAVLTHPDLPAKLEYEITIALEDLFNHGDSTEIDAFQRTPIWIAMVLRAFKANADAHGEAWAQPRRYWEEEKLVAGS